MVLGGNVNVWKEQEWNKTGSWWNVGSSSCPREVVVLISESLTLLKVRADSLEPAAKRSTGNHHMNPSFPACLFLFEQVPRHVLPAAPLPVEASHI